MRPRTDDSIKSVSRDGVVCARRARLRGAWLTLLAVTLSALSVLGGCGAPVLNPEFPLTSEDALSALKEMRHEPVMPPRPIVVLGGLFDPGLIGFLASDLRQLTHPDARIVIVTFVGKGTFEECRAHLIESVRRAVPNEWLHETTEVDVVGFSMGGLVARDASMSNGDGQRLKIARLFTISTPHRGARLADLPTFDQRALDMRAGSAFLERLNAGLEEAEYQLIPYVRLDDAVVGSENAAPIGRSALWVSNPPFSFSHLGAAGDPRIVADIARRIRGEQPFALATTDTEGLAQRTDVERYAARRAHSSAVSAGSDTAAAP